MRSSLFTSVMVLAAIVAAETGKFDFIDTQSGDGRCTVCRAAMGVINPALSTDTMNQVAQLYFKNAGISRPDLDADSLLTALQGLVLTPDYFCSAVAKVCSQPVYEAINLEDDIAEIMKDKPADADHAIDALYKKIAAD